jgi:polyribonucleotide nucleotidyltransferase
MPGKDGLLHISEVRKLNGGQRVEDVGAILTVGQKIMVEISKMDDRGKLSLTPVVDDADAADTDSSVAASVGPAGPAEG